MGDKHIIIIMNNNVKIEEKIIEIKNFLKDKVEQVKLGGSRALSFINNPKDYDLIVVCKDEETRQEVKNLFKNQYDTKDLITNYNIDIIFRTTNRDSEAANSIYPYIWHYSEPDVMAVIDFEKLRETIVNRCYKFEEEKNYHYAFKLWYYVYITMCIIKNNSYDLTEEQIENVNILHDRREEDLETRKQLIDEMMSEVIKWAI